MKVRLFANLCKDTEANYTSLLYYCEVRWQSHAKVIQRVFELREEIVKFLVKNHNEGGICLGLITLLLNLDISLKFVENLAF